MDVSKLDEEQLKVAVRILFENREKFPCGTIDVPYRNNMRDTKIKCDYCYFESGQDVTLVVAHRVTYAYFNADLCKILAVKHNNVKMSSAIVHNVRQRATMKMAGLSGLMLHAQQTEPKIIEEIFKDVDLTKEAENEKDAKVRAKKYSEKKRSLQFTYREQQEIAKIVLLHEVGKELLLVDKKLFKDSSIKLRTKLSFNRGANYFVDLAFGISWAEDIDLSGKPLYDAIIATLNLDLEKLMDYLNGHTEVCRRFATAFDSRFTTSALVDTSARVRSLAKEKHKGKK